ncbi:MAG: hypothetical protein JXM79_14285 [Sedimentisphaerales bacterium]|nr:hypothetical protein [Sedimentisphaerales bacterium]
MRLISVNRACRPIRLAFLVRPGNQGDFLRAIEINTVIWGGIYNPIIPFYKRAPQVWKDHKFGNPTSVEILRGYISTFQPDFMVKPDDCSIPPDIFPEKRTISPKDVLSPPLPQEYSPTRSPVRFGVDMTDVYHEVYSKVFRFVQRHPQKTQIPSMQGHLRLLGACLWGLFPADKRLAYYEREFAEIFDAKAENLKSITTLLLGNIYPLKVTRYKLEASGQIPEPCVFVMDETNALDLIDFWNLRACGGLCVPLPVSFSGALASEVKDFMNLHLKREVRSDSCLTYPRLIGARSLDVDEIRQIADNLPLSKQHRRAFGLYPRLWEGRIVTREYDTPVSFHFKAKYDQFNVEEDSIELNALEPEFAGRFGRGGPRWINVVSTNEYYSGRLPANVIPDGLREVRRIFGAYSLHGPWISDGGVALCCEHKNWDYRWRLPEAKQIGTRWASEKGYELVLSDSGRILESMVDVAGSLFDGRWFADEGIIRALGRMAEGQAVPSGEFRQLVKRANEQDEILQGLTDRHLQYFQKKGILRLCMKVQCPHCGQHPLYTLEELAHRIECRQCLRHFEFPLASPPSGGWFYRSIGPFASPGFAQGAYSALLALRFLTEQLEARTTCVPSCKLVKNGKELEADFICFWHKPSWAERDRHVIFAECKCFGNFEDKDVRRMQEFARKFSGSVMAFCTLKNSLDPRERTLLRKFAESGSRPKRGLSWPTPVLVLTGNELCLLDPGGFNHRMYGENPTGLARRMPRGQINMLDLCSASQQEYLGLPSIHQRWRGYYERRSNIKKGK